MDPVVRVKNYLLHNVGHMTFPGKASFDLTNQKWFVPIYCRTGAGAIVVGDVELDGAGQIVYAPSREEMLTRFGEATASAPRG
jgi:hypothetical protein